jgi:hypothetical protein
MGLYDSFLIKIPVQCTNCRTGGHKEFQTKQFNCMMDIYEEGKPAVAHYLRMETEEEYEEKMRHYRETEPELADSALAKICGCMHRTDNVIPGSQIPDGEYNVYTGCDECDDLFFVTAVIKDGIFIGVKEIDKYK